MKYTGSSAVECWTRRNYGTNLISISFIFSDRNSQQLEASSVALACFLLVVAVDTHNLKLAV